MSKVIRLNDEIIRELDDCTGSTYNEKIAWLLGKNYNEICKNIDKMIVTNSNNKQVTSSNNVTNSNKVTSSNNKEVTDSNKSKLEVTSKPIVTDNKLINSNIVTDSNSKPIVTEQPKREINPWIFHKHTITK